MADFADDFAMGEEFVDSEKATVRATAAVVAGQVLEVTGVHADSNTLEVRPQVGNNQPRFVALRAGAINDFIEVLYRGTVKVTFGANVTPGSSSACLGGKLVDSGHAGASGKCGYIISDGAADDDTGLVYFDGGAS